MTGLELLRNRTGELDRKIWGQVLDDSNTKQRMDLFFLHSGKPKTCLGRVARLNNQSKRVMLVTQMDQRK